MHFVILESVAIVSECLRGFGLAQPELLDLISDRLADRWSGHRAQIWCIEDVDAALDDREIDPESIDMMDKIAVLDEAIHRESVYSFIFGAIGDAAIAHLGGDSE